MSKPKQRERTTEFLKAGRIGNDLSDELIGVSSWPNFGTKNSITEEALRSSLEPYEDYEFGVFSVDELRNEFVRISKSRNPEVRKTSLSTTVPAMWIYHGHMRFVDPNIKLVPGGKAERTCAKKFTADDAEKALTSKEDDSGTLFQADYAAIEARTLAHIQAEKYGLDAFQVAEHLVDFDGLVRLLVSADAGIAERLKKRIDNISA